MAVDPRRVLAFVVLACLFAVSLVPFSGRQGLSFAQPPLNRTTSVWDGIHVVHLPARTDRFERMSKLANALSLDFTFHTATLADSYATDKLMEHVRREREAEGWCLGDRTACRAHPNDSSPFFEAPLPYDFQPDVLEEGMDNEWEATSLFLPDAYLSSQASLPYTPAHADLWDSAALDAVRDSPIPVLAETTTNDVLRDKRQHAFLSYKAYNRRRRFDPALTVRVLPLARGEVACWNSHVRVIQDFLASGRQSALIVEDDVDVEWDLARRAEELWTVLPASYDVVFLGHCWSHEDVFSPLNETVPALRPAHTPKCNHGYAVSRPGALKMMRHLRSPGFAYSMPLDRAFTHLIATQRIEAYSVFPPIVVQTVDTRSDIQPDVRKVWQDELQDSTLKRLGLLP